MGFGAEANIAAVTTCLNGRSPLPPDRFPTRLCGEPDLGWPRKGSHFSVRIFIGHHAAPTFFRGNDCYQGRRQNCVGGLILMGDWRDADRSQYIEDADARESL